MLCSTPERPPACGTATSTEEKNDKHRYTDEKDDQNGTTRDCVSLLDKTVTEDTDVAAELLDALTVLIAVDWVKSATAAVVALVLGSVEVARGCGNGDALVMQVCSPMDNIRRRVDDNDMVDMFVDQERV